MKRSQQAMAHMFSALVGALVGTCGGAILGYLIADFRGPVAPDAADYDYLQWWPYYIDSFLRHGKGILTGGGLGACVGGVTGYLLNRQAAQESGEQPPAGAS